MKTVSKNYIGLTSILILVCVLVGCKQMAVYNFHGETGATNSSVALKLPPLKIQPVQIEPLRVEPVNASPITVKPIEVQPVEVHPSGSVQVDPVKFNKVEVSPIGIGPVEVRASKPLEVQVSAKEPVQISGKLDAMNVVATVNPVQVVMGDKPIKAVVEVQLTNLSLGTLPIQITVTSTPTRVELIAPFQASRHVSQEKHKTESQSDDGEDADNAGGQDAGHKLLLYALLCIIGGGGIGGFARNKWAILNPNENGEIRYYSKKPISRESKLTVRRIIRYLTWSSPRADSIQLGIISAALVPLFLKFVSSDILSKIKTDNMSLLTLLGLCLIAGILGEEFIFKVIEMSRKWTNRR